MATDDGEEPDLSGPETGLPLQPVAVAKYDLDEPYHPDKANMQWQVTVIHVAMESPDTYGFYDQDGDCLNSCVPFRGRLPTLPEVLDFLINLE